MVPNLAGPHFGCNLRRVGGYPPARFPPPCHPADIFFARQGAAQKMSDAERLVLGMSLEAARRAMQGWTARPFDAIVSYDKLHVIQTWDFIPPLGSAERPSDSRLRPER